MQYLQGGGLTNQLATLHRGYVKVPQTKNKQKIFITIQLIKLQYSVPVKYSLNDTTVNRMYCNLWIEFKFV